MTDDEHGRIFLAPTDTPAEQSPRPAVDGSAEAMRRLRRPFDVDDTAGPGRRSGAE